MSVPADNQNLEQNPNPAGDGHADEASVTGGAPGQQGGQDGGQGNPKPPGDGQGTSHSVPLPVYLETRNELKALKRQIESLQGGRSQQSQQQSQDTDPEPQEAQYSDYNEYVRAQARWEGRQAATQQFAKLSAQQAMQSQAQETARQRQQATEKYFRNTANEDAAFHEAAQDLPLGDFLWHQIMRSDNPGPVLKHFIANKAEAQRIGFLPPAEQLVVYGEIRAKLAGASGQPNKVTQMPKPMAPVGSGKSGAKQSYSDAMTQEDFNASFPPIW